MTWRGEGEYEALRRSAVWNRRTPARFPDVIVRAADDADVVAAVRFARARGLKVAVRGGGHSWIGSPLRDGGVLIDLSRLRSLTVDPASRTATIQPAVTGRALLAALRAHGLAFPVGHCPSVALSGFLLSGGNGWNSGAWGPACLSVLGVDVVTAAGTVVGADERRHPTLLWAARGAGPGFPGVVTRYRLRLHPRPRAITTSTYVYSLRDLEAVAGWAAATAPALPRIVELTLLVEGADQAPRLVLSGTAFADSLEEATAALAHLETCPAAGRALERRVDQPTPFEALLDALGTRFPEGRRYAADALWSEADPAEVLRTLGEHVVRAPSPGSFVLASIAAGPPPVIAPSAAAFSAAGRLFVGGYAVWDDPAADAVNTRWVREAMAALEPAASGYYIGEADLLADPSRVRRSFAAPTWRRLRALRRRLDPDGVFHSYLGHQ
jgi:FAD/FMN-containing dehydrogenase